MKLSILCFTELKSWSGFFIEKFARLVAELPDTELVIAVDRAPTALIAESDLVHAISVESQGYIESVLDEGINACRGEYVLRMDDDEVITPAMSMWLHERLYEAHPAWKFATANMWQDDKSFIFNAPLWPDHHDRLALKQYAGGRGKTPHAGAVYPGVLAPVVFEHHKFLVKSYDERVQIAARYDAIGQGLGTGGMTAFTLPERAFDSLLLGEVGFGDLLACAASKLIEVPVSVPV
jgi:hypothetical protein